MYMGWYDDTPKKPTDRKVDEALAAYAARFGRTAGVVLVNAADLCQRADVLVVTGESQAVPVQRNTFLVGLIG
jgi:hypothetical protein